MYKNFAKDLRTITMSAANTKDTTAPKASNIAEYNSEVEIGIRENDITKVLTFETCPYQIGVIGILIDCFQSTTDVLHT